MSLSPSALKQPNPALFDGKPASIQRKSKELVIFCLQLEHIHEYLTSLKLLWPCFCTMHESEWVAINTNIQDIPKPLSCQIFTWGKEGTFAVCHYDNPRCQFFIDLQRVFLSSERKENYVPMGPQESALSRLAGALDMPTLPLPSLPFLPGFLGENGVQLGKKQVSYFNSVNWFLLPYVGFQNTTLVARSLLKLTETPMLFPNLSDL
ncbi:hypothetical protein B0H16DRAFT_1713494 [Mycena metata]|uniref:Uncharacterized protein n=1 Tax=Mycena metata TaxID=1033252 RepID=A0AAD7NTV2_9AGAR|nr:hypothetical protein B0H16DRAFT_1713494 [Mycena metata]